MPIRIPDSLPATSVLESENIFVMTEHRALHQDIRPLNLLILNLMPTKIVTETQILRKLSNTPLQINVQLLQTISHTAQHTDSQHLDAFYTTFRQIQSERFDGMIITGAPVENLDFENVDYWHELCQIMDWTRTHVHSTLHICWGAQAGLYYHYGIPKRTLPKKLFGIYEHDIIRKRSPLFRGFDDRFYAPHSRYAEVALDDVLAVPELELLALSREAGIFGVKSADNRRFFVFAHPEYDPDTLALEYFRDVERGLDIPVPAHYFPNDDPSQPPMVTWRSAGQLLYTNWLNYYVYQTTPYDPREISNEA
ncbi:MAG TPA: homoserine O-succinyltransferase [Candidatus Enterenecus merdae]|nr:homoserine O-succinyltransferase [Candidatus Enterenecus merdae]